MCRIRSRVSMRRPTHLEVVFQPSSLSATVNTLEATIPHSEPEALEADNIRNVSYYSGDYKHMQQCGETYFM
jgi:hypothetical protein